MRRWKVEKVYWDEQYGHVWVATRPDPHGITSFMAHNWQDAVDLAFSRAYKSEDEDGEV